MVLDLFNVVKCGGETPDDGSVEETLFGVNLVEIIVAITERSTGIFTLLKFVVDVSIFDNFDTVVDGNSLIEDSLASFVVDSNN